MKVVVFCWCWILTLLLTETRSKHYWISTVQDQVKHRNSEIIWHVSQYWSVLFYWQVEAVVKMMEKELGSGWILHKDCQVLTEFSIILIFVQAIGSEHIHELTDIIDKQRELFKSFHQDQVYFWCSVVQYPPFSSYIHRFPHCIYSGSYLRCFWTYFSYPNCRFIYLFLPKEL